MIAIASPPHIGGLRSMRTLGFAHSLNCAVGSTQAESSEGSLDSTPMVMLHARRGCTQCRQSPRFTCSDGQDDLLHLYCLSFACDVGVGDPPSSQAWVDEYIARIPALHSIGW